ncbi:hypothetical protein N7445_007790 [Penicillium cf. griseofulvum]|nr:hypothetical protein N7445_007790 [Penicillium cf. griseofulvum]
MRWFHLVNCLLMALAWSSNAATAHPANSTSHSLGKRFSKANIECSAYYGHFVWAHLEEIEEIVRKHQKRTLGLLRANDPPTIKILDDDANEVLRSTFNTFTSIYGKFFWGPQDSKSKDGKDRVKKVLENFSAMRSRASTSGYISNVEIRCDDTWLIPLQYFDSRHPEREAKWLDNGWIDFTESKGACSDAGHTHYAWVNDHIHGTDESVLTLCQDYIEYWIAQWNADIRLPFLRGNEYSPEKYKLDDFSGPFISVALLHELTHVSQIFGSPPTGKSFTLGN